MKPTLVPMPNEEKRMNAQTSAGILRRKVAMPRIYLAKRGRGEIFSLANSDMKKASIAAIVVEDIASASVINILERISPTALVFGKAGGKKSREMKCQKASLFFNSTNILKFV